MTKTALITGATSGFGAATARRFVKEGWKVIVTGRRAERLDALVDELGGATVAHALCFDIQDADAIQVAVDGLPADFADVDLLINNAGLALGTAPAQECKLSDWMTMIDTNNKGLVAITRIMLDKLIERKGAIVNLASIASNWPYPGGNVYGATKAFVQQFSLGIRCDLAGTGVRVTSIEPGLCESEFTLVRTGGNKEAYDNLYRGADPIQPEDIAESIFWVANLPAHVNVNSLEVMPVSQSWSPFAIHRKEG
ncbi:MULTISPECIES: SDR family oxidoreductase [Thalassospira]|uniref:Malonic semialdehyde reductase n=1 Tax=Thalassospira profundimaris TaxID=502049 RepID=A0A367V2E4_9PROT|nr:MULTISPECIES: SDR family oxidoreductase [Thalassospira]KZB69665.1 NAD(P)-dependent oxidoreductase [Thalassospira sp. MCCC 1A01148]MBR9900548.1 SDR family oxidoreductase [Rhodospirillales bacterium]RCK19333.1 malonic semialdehyde reductase [Thalassospira profundimaris]